MMEEVNKSEVMKRVERRMGILMGVSLSLCLSLFGCWFSGHFSLGAFVTSFLISTVISLLIGFLIPTHKIGLPEAPGAGAQSEGRSHHKSGLRSDLHAADFAGDDCTCLQQCAEARRFDLVRRHVCDFAAAFAADRLCADFHSDAAVCKDVAEKRGHSETGVISCKKHPASRENAGDGMLFL